MTRATLTSTILLFIFLTISITAEIPPSYYLFDNTTPASIHDVLNDPLLAIRAKPQGTRLLPYDIENSWKAFAQLHADEEFQAAEYQHIGIFLNPTFHLQITEIQSDEHLSFSLKTNISDPCQCWWQISINPDFSDSVYLEEITDHTNLVTLAPLQETLFNAAQEYFVRARASSEGQWSPWSEAYSFSVNKPQPVKNAQFRKNRDGTFFLNWNSGSDSETRYLVFASHSKDFVPSIYTDIHLYSDESNNNLVAIAESSSIEIDPNYPYYRIVVEKDGRYSVPSPLIYIWDKEIYPERDVLTVVNQAIARVAIANNYPAYEESAKSGWPHQHIKKSVWKQVKPYLLPENHPIKEKLDRIFKKNRVILNLDTMKKAGFHKPTPRKWTHVIVTKHQDVPGYIFKAYVDAQRMYKRKPPYHFWVLRAKGVQMIADEIDRRGWNHLFKTPNKWIYPLPPEPAPPKEYQRKNFILVEDDMEILNDSENRAMWKSDEVTTTLLDQVHSIVNYLGLSDCAKPDNIPFSKDGKISFIDTQTFETWPVRWDKMTPFLSKPNKKYWKQLTKKK